MSITLSFEDQTTLKVKREVVEKIPYWGAKLNRWNGGAEQLVVEGDPVVLRNLLAWQGGEPLHLVIQRRIDAMMDELRIEADYLGCPLPHQIFGPEQEAYLLATVNQKSQLPVRKPNERSEEELAILAKGGYHLITSDWIQWLREHQYSRLDGFPIPQELSEEILTFSLEELEYMRSRGHDLSMYLYLFLEDRALNFPLLSLLAEDGVRLSSRELQRLYSRRRYSVDILSLLGHPISEPISAGDLSLFLAEDLHFILRHPSVVQPTMDAFSQIVLSLAKEHQLMGMKLHEVKSHLKRFRKAGFPLLPRTILRSIESSLFFLALLPYISEALSGLKLDGSSSWDLVFLERLIQLEIYVLDSRYLDILLRTGREDRVRTLLSLFPERELEWSVLLKEEQQAIGHALIHAQCYPTWTILKDMAFARRFLSWLALEPPRHLPQLVPILAYWEKHGHTQLVSQGRCLGISPYPPLP